MAPSRRARSSYCPPYPLGRSAAAVLYRRVTKQNGSTQHIPHTTHHTPHDRMFGEREEDESRYSDHTRHKCDVRRARGGRSLLLWGAEELADGLS